MSSDSESCVPVATEASVEAVARPAKKMYPDRAAWLAENERSWSELCKDGARQIRHEVRRYIETESETDEFSVELDGHLGGAVQLVVAQLRSEGWRCFTVFERDWRQSCGVLPPTDVVIMPATRWKRYDAVPHSRMLLIVS